MAGKQAIAAAPKTGVADKKAPMQAPRPQAKSSPADSKAFAGSIDRNKPAPAAKTTNTPQQTGPKSPIPTQQPRRSQAAPNPPPGPVAPGAAEGLQDIAKQPDSRLFPNPSDTAGQFFKVLSGPQEVAKSGSLLPSSERVAEYGGQLKAATGWREDTNRIIDGSVMRMQFGSRQADPIKIGGLKSAPDDVSPSPAVLTQNGFAAKAQQAVDPKAAAYQRDGAARDMSIGVRDALDRATGTSANSGPRSADQVAQARTLTSGLVAQQTAGAASPEQKKLIGDRADVGLNAWIRGGDAETTRSTSPSDPDLPFKAAQTGLGSERQKAVIGTDIEHYNAASIKSPTTQAGTTSVINDAANSIRNDVADEISHGGDYRGLFNGGPTQQEAIEAGRYVASRTDNSDGGRYTRSQVMQQLERDYAVRPSQLDEFVSK